MTKVHHEIDDLKEEIETLKEEKTTTERTAGKLESEKDVIEGEVTRTKSSLKYIAFTLIASAIVDIALGVFLNTLPNFPVYYVILALIAVMGLEAKIIFEIPKHV